MQKKGSDSPLLIRVATPLDAEAVAFVQTKTWQTAYAGILDQVFLDTLDYEERLSWRRKVFDLEHITPFVALSNEQIVGFADVGPARSDGLSPQSVGIGEIYAIYVLEEHQRKGLGKALFSRCREVLVERGFETFIVWVLVDNHRARRFYEGEGGKMTGEKTVTIGEKQYNEYSYEFKLLD